ncbi:hypothetical protein ZEAMMB73_Zm00001d029262 [Zea mays]|uniref:Uncharacterized protein n=1 Tax=Zea mays TaxID=4577 RepID=A0A1D6K3Y3_MAIZE|nr:hypothetical protein ZEAMMB73_Zm00001d029262 [Zea mays]
MKNSHLCPCCAIQGRRFRRPGSTHNLRSPGNRHMSPPPPPLVGLHRSSPALRRRSHVLYGMPKGHAVTPTPNTPPPPLFCPSATGCIPGAR